ncbi:lysis system i-spanin subunit Rz [Pseudomonas sp. C9-3]|uniref:lysis system i-spanin subunit Rz n=1 Tax=Pseudomonas sp. C9-3 TaxID=3078264 RepID=UPI0028E74FD4|nr:lysis system i-spanin subunit Rz [Pseudomonas sp. C9-3]
MAWLLNNWKPLLCALLLSLAAAAGWIANGWRLGQQIEQHQAAFQADLSTINLAAAKAQQEANEQRQALAKAIQQDSATRYQEYTDAQHQNAQLRADLLTAQRRLSVKVSGCSAAAQVPGTAGTGSVGDAGGRADLDPGDSAALLGIVNRGDDAIRQLTACQAYVKRILGE